MNNVVFELYYDHIPTLHRQPRLYVNLSRTLPCHTHTRARANAYNVYDIHPRTDEHPSYILYIS